MTPQTNTFWSSFQIFKGLFFFSTLKRDAGDAAEYPKNVVHFVGFSAGILVETD